jgi:hypothetical protein
MAAATTIRCFFATRELLLERDEENFIPTYVPVHAAAKFGEVSSAESLQ